MEKIALNATHEIELYANTGLDEFTAQLFLETKGVTFCFDLVKDKKDPKTFSFKIPEELGKFLKEPVNYIIYVYIDNARFKADSGKIHVISEDVFGGAKIKGLEKTDIKFKTSIKPKTSENPIPPKKEDKSSEPVKEDFIVGGQIVEESLTKTPNIESSVQHKNLDNTPTEARNKIGKTSSIRDIVERNRQRKELRERSEEINSKVKSILREFKEAK